MSQQQIAELKRAIVHCVGELSMLKYFPSDEYTRAAIMRLIETMVTSPEQVRELGRRVLAHYNEWPGPLELRGVFCTFAKPKDGIEANCTNAGTLGAAIEGKWIEAHSGIERAQVTAGSAAMVKQIAETKGFPK